MCLLSIIKAAHYDYDLKMKSPTNLPEFQIELCVAPAFVLLFQAVDQDGRTLYECKSLLHSLPKRCPNCGFHRVLGNK